MAISVIHRWTTMSESRAETGEICIAYIPSQLCVLYLSLSKCSLAEQQQPSFAALSDSLKLYLPPNVTFNLTTTA